MEGETQMIPKRIPLPIVGAISISVDEYLPYVMRKYHHYTVYVCQICGYLEVFLS
jgi:hypothetical protein